MKPMGRVVTLLLLGALLTGCLVQFTDPTHTPRPTASASPTPRPTASPSQRPTPTPGLADVPRFSAGDTVAVTAGGLRVRARPGAEQRVLVSLAAGVPLIVVLGPVWVDDTGWYRVHDALRADPDLPDGWVAAGTASDPFLAPASFAAGHNPVIAGFAGQGGGQFGPITLDTNRASISWLAAPEEPDGCVFFVDLAAAGAEPVTAVHATIGGVPAPGELFRQFFRAHDALIDTELSITVTSDCSWALTFLRT